MSDQADRAQLVDLMSSLAVTRGWEEAANGSWYVGGWRVGVAPTGPPRLLAFKDGLMREFGTLGELRAFVEGGTAPPSSPAAPGPMSPMSPMSPPEAGAASPFAIAGRLIGVSVIIGAGLGLAVMMFLVLTGFFDESDDLEDIGNAIVGGALIIGVVAFALLVGIVMAGVDGIVAARLATSPSDARAAGARIAGAVGHLALVAAVGAVLTVGFLIFAGGDGASEQTPTPTLDPAQCVQFFGPDAELCSQEEEDDDASSVPWDDILKAMAGVIPAGLTGAGAASMMHRRS